MIASAHSTSQVWRDGASAPDHLAEEVPVSLRYNGQAYVVMMCSPQDLEDFARGFSVTEGLVGSVRDILDIKVLAASGDDAVQIDIRVTPDCAQVLASRERNLQGRTGCGMCGEKTLDAAMRPAPRVPAGVAITASALRRALEAIKRHQPVNGLTGATHAAAWVSTDGLILAACEDVGRHNALDKLIGRLLAQGADLSRGFCVITSRASYEMVHKAAVVGMPLLAAISAPTALAVRVAQGAGLTLIGFARRNQHVIYSCPSRLLEAS